MTKARVMVASLLLVAVMWMPASADPIQVVSGTFVIHGYLDNRGIFSLTAADGSTVSGGWPYGVAQAFSGCGGSSCGGGTSVSPVASFTFGVPFYFGEPYASGSAVVGGRAYEHILFGGTLAFSGPAAAIPPRLVESWEGTLVSLTLPFEFTGTLNGYELLGYREAQLRFSQQLAGSGQARLEFVADGPVVGEPARFTYLRTTYNFDATPVPEPATLLLLGTGLAGAVAAARRRR